MSIADEARAALAAVQQPNRDALAGALAQVFEMGTLPNFLREADAVLAALAVQATGEVETREFLSITEQKSSVWWEYGVEREQATAMSSREAAEREIERQRTRKGGYRIMGQRLVRRLVSAWEVTP